MMATGLLLFIFGLVTSTISAQSQASPVPFWTHDLGPEIIDKAEHPNIYRNLLNPAGNNTAGLAFIDERTLVIYELLYRPNSLSERHPKLPEQSSFMLRFTAFNLGDSSPSELGQLPTLPEWTIVRKIRGGWVMRTGYVVRFTDEHLRSELTTQLRKNMSADISVSPDGKSILIDEWNAQGGTYKLYDAPSFTQRLQWTSASPGIGFKSISDAEVLKVASNGIYTGRFGKNLEPVFSSCDSMTCWDAYFLGDNNIGISGRNFLTILSDGHMVLREELCKQCAVSTKIASSQEAPYTAIPITERKGNIITESRQVIKQIINVYDLAPVSKIFSVSVTPLPTHHYDFALSPSGEELAILRDREVLIYKVRQ